ncbi:MAG: ABC transporter permease [Thermoplasmata archaeon]
MSAESRFAWWPRPDRAESSDYIRQGSQFYGLYARELIKTFRNPLVLLITLVQPFMWLAFFGSSFASLSTQTLDAVLHAPPGTGYLAFLLPGVLSTSMLSVGMFGSMSTIQDKRFGFMKRVLLTPTGRSTVYLSKALGSATRGMVQIPVMIVAAWVFGVRFGGDPLMWAGWLLGLVLLGFGFSAFFLAVTASSTDWQTPGVISNFITMPLMFASGALFPAQNYPVWMQDITHVNPVAFASLLGRGILVYGTPDWTYLGYLAVFATAMVLIGTLVASKYLKVE